MMTTSLNRRTLLGVPAIFTAISFPLVSLAQPPKEGFFLLANPTGDALTYLKDGDGKIVPMAPSPWGVATGPAGVAYISSAQSLTIIDAVVLRQIAEISLRTEIGEVGYGEYRPGGMGIAVTSDGRTVAVGVHLSGASGLVDLFDVATGGFPASVSVGVRPFDVAASPDSRFVYSIDHDSFTITAIDLETLATTTFEAAPLGYGEFDKPHYAAVQSDGTLLLPYSGQILWMLDPITGESRSLPLTSNAHQHGIALSDDETTAHIVGTGPAGPSQGPPSLTVLDLESGDERIIELSRPHEHVALTEDGKTAILTGGYTFADGGWDGVTQIDLETGEITELAILGRPLGIARLN